MSYINAMITSGLAFAIPLFIMAVGGIYSEKSGITNLAVEGFQGFGAFCGAVVAVFLGMNTGLSSSSIIYVAMLFSFIGGAIYAIIHALLCIKFRADQVISGVVINILGVALTTFLTTLMYKMKFGMRLRACGENPQAVDAAGGDVAKTRFISVMISGGLSGIGGICFAYSLLSQFSPSIYLGYGYLAIAAMIFGNWNIIPTFFVCIFFGIARAGGYQLCLAMGLASIYSDLFLMIPYILTLLLLMFFSKRNHPPKAAGEVYDKGKR